VVQHARYGKVGHLSVENNARIGGESGTETKNQQQQQQQQQQQPSEPTDAMEKHWQSITSR